MCWEQGIGHLLTDLCNHRCDSFLCNPSLYLLPVTSDIIIIIIIIIIITTVVINNFALPVIKAELKPLLFVIVFY
jgi:hypothetical protein